MDYRKTSSVAAHSALPSLCLGYFSHHSPIFGQIVFEAVRGKGTLGDIAIDDIRLRDGPCTPFGDCNFENGDMCTWKNAESTRDDFDWVRAQGSTSSDYTGPPNDHTLGTPYGELD